MRDEAGFRIVLRVLGAGLGAWLAGLVAYVLLLRVFWGQTLGSDWPAVAFWSALAWALALPTVYLPTLMLTRRLRGGFRPVALFSLVAALLGVVPTTLIAVYWGGSVAALATPEAVLFLALFTVVGIVFGLGYAVGRADEPPEATSSQ